ncbi:hypothetical protein LSAT2_031134 [Lamellibrachia satsuma]|nr:hypothetical protein LSAT2_031134 [Lamellibrachia satsuma]
MYGLSCRVVSCRDVSCRVVSCRVVSCRVSSPQCIHWTFNLLHPLWISHQIRTTTDNDQVGRRDYFEPTVKMSRLLLTLALCLLGLMAASSLAKEKVPSVIGRPGPWWPCGFCYWNGWRDGRWGGHVGYVQPPCYRWRWSCVRWSWGHCVRWAWYIETYCCRPGILFYLPFPYPGRYMCFNGNYHGGCGGFMGSGSNHPACQYNGMKMCGPSYRLSGSKCIKDNNWSAAKKVPGTAVKVTKNPMKMASRPPANVKEGMMVAAKDRAQARRR